MLLLSLIKDFDFIGCEFVKKAMLQKIILSQQRKLYFSWFWQDRYRYTSRVTHKSSHLIGTNLGPGTQQSFKNNKLELLD